MTSDDTRVIPLPEAARTRLVERLAAIARANSEKAIPIAGVGSLTMKGYWPHPMTPDAKRTWLPFFTLSREIIAWLDEGKLVAPKPTRDADLDAFGAAVSEALTSGAKVVTVPTFGTFELRVMQRPRGEHKVVTFIAATELKQAIAAAI